MPKATRKCSCQSCQICGQVKCRDKVGTHPGHRGLFARVGRAQVSQTEVCKLAGHACGCVGVG